MNTFFLTVFDDNLTLKQRSSGENKLKLIRNSWELTATAGNTVTMDVAKEDLEEDS